MSTGVRFNILDNSFDRSSNVSFWKEGFSSIVFSEGKVNQNIKKSIFEFNPPSYYDIIRK